MISRLRAGADGFSSTELERIHSAFLRFKERLETVDRSMSYGAMNRIRKMEMLTQDPDNPEIHKDELGKARAVDLWLMYV